MRYYSLFYFTAKFRFNSLIMGHHHSKKLPLPKTDVPPTCTLSPLERAVLNKNTSQTRELLLDRDNINETGEFGLSLLHLAIIPTLSTSDLEHHCDYYNLMDYKVHKIASIKQMVAILAQRGAVLVPASDKINPLECVYYCSLTNKTLCDQLAKILFDLIQFSISDIIRYTVWKLVCGRFNPQFKSVNYTHHYHLTAQFVKHGIRADDYFSGLTERPAPFQHCHEFREITMVAFKSEFFSTCFCPETGCSICPFHYLELIIDVWHKFWEFNDPRNLFLDSLLNLFKNNFAQDKRTKLLTEKYISLWLSSRRRDSRNIYEMMSFISCIFKITTKDMGVEELSRVGDFTLFKSFIALLPDVILTVKGMHMLEESVDTFLMLCFNMYQLLVKLYGSPSTIPYYEVEVFSDSINKLLPHLPTKHNGSYKCTIHHIFINSIDNRDLFAFIARFDPDINVRNSDTGRTPIQQALLYGNIYMVQTLLENGANPFTVDREGNSFINQLDSIIRSLGTGPAKDVYEEVKNKYVILNKPYPLVTIASNVIVKRHVPFDVLKRQPRLYHMLLHYLPPD